VAADPVMGILSVNILLEIDERTCAAFFHIIIKGINNLNPK
jgi:hypothetical protein